MKLWIGSPTSGLTLLLCTLAVELKKEMGVTCVTVSSFFYGILSCCFEGKHEGEIESRSCFTGIS